MRQIARALVASASLFGVASAHADEGGVSFWLPGQFSSFAAAPGEPGWSLPLLYYHSSTDASASRLFRRGGALAAGLDVQADLAIAAPSYVFGTPIAGGQASVGITGLFGRARVQTSGTLVVADSALRYRR